MSSLNLDWYLYPHPLFMRKGDSDRFPLTEGHDRENEFYIEAIYDGRIKPYQGETERLEHINWTMKSMMKRTEDITHVKDLLARSKRVVVSTGAGVSEESGVPTFRFDKEALWLNHKLEDVATPDGFQRDPELVWRFYNSRRRQLRSTTPNQGHYALVEMEKKAKCFTLITQNIDGLHKDAGSSNLIELHGDLKKTKCSMCSYSIYESEPRFPGTKPDNNEQIKCPECGSNLRPDIVWFNEPLPVDKFRLASASINTMEEGDVFFTIGTSHLVYPAADLPTFAAQKGAHVIEINKKTTYLKNHIRNMVCLEGRSGTILPLLVK